MADGSHLIRFPRDMGRPLAGWRVFCPGCSYSRVFTAAQAAEEAAHVTLPEFTCARCGTVVNVVDVPIKDTGAVKGCCRG